MTSTDIKLYALNSASLAISMTEIEPFLKIALLLISIGYTIAKWMNMRRQNNEKE